MCDEPDHRYYFGDEAGDPNLFSRHGRVIVGKPGVSKHFMVAAAYMPDPEMAGRQLDDLRNKLLNDPYFSGVPSMQPGAKCTALFFHAKDDLPEIRYHVFKLLPELGVKVIAAIRRKDVLAEHAEFMFKACGSKLHADHIYDELIKRIFKNLQHKALVNTVVFARRGKKDRQYALAKALDRAKQNFETSCGTQTNTKTRILTDQPCGCTGLQVVDYYLWALQRMYERQEDRFFKLLQSGYRLIMDLDDTRRKPYGEWYSNHNPLTLEKIKPAAG